MIVSGSGLIANARFLGQEGAPENAAPYNWIGVLGMCSYPEYPKYGKGPATEAESYQCSAR